MTYQPGDRVWRWVEVGSDDQFTIQDIQPLTVVRVNRVTVTVRTDAGSQFRIDPRNIEGRYIYDEEGR